MKSKLSKAVLLLSTFFFILFYSQQSFSLEIEGVNISNNTNVGNDSLVLNGAGVRTKFFFNIYIGSLYLISKESNIEKILKDTHSKQISLYFLYNEVTKEKLVDGWTAGFKNNNSDEIFESLKAKLDKFNSFFITTHKGDTVTLDFIANTKTRVTINKQLKGEIEGANFQTALLKVWLGDHPADYTLKDAMLGVIED